MNFGVAVAILAQNYPMSPAFVNLFNRTVRTVAADIRNALTWRLQELSIGFHNRSSSSLLQAKIVRDVENVELTLQQAVGPGMSAIFVLLGAVVTTAVRVPAFVLVFAVMVPIRVILVRMLQRSSSQRNERYRRRVEHLFGAGRGNGGPHACHPRPRHGTACSYAGRRKQVQLLKKRSAFINITVEGTLTLRQRLD